MSKFVESGADWLAGLHFPIYNACKHHRGGATCSAFPDRIPKAILTGERDHHEPYPGDGGIRFEGGPEESSGL